VKPARRQSDVSKRGRRCESRKPRSGDTEASSDVSSDHFASEQETSVRVIASVDKKDQEDFFDDMLWANNSTSSFTFTEKVASENKISPKTRISIGNTSMKGDFADFPSSGELSASFGGDEDLFDKAREEARRQMLDTSRKGPVRVRVAVVRKTGSTRKLKTQNEVEMLDSPSTESPSATRRTLLRRPSLDDHFDVLSPMEPARNSRRSSQSVHANSFNPSNMEKYVSSAASLPGDIKQKKKEPSAPSREVLHREGRTRSSGALVGVVDEILRTRRDQLDESPSTPPVQKSVLLQPDLEESYIRKSPGRKDSGGFGRLDEPKRVKSPRRSSLGRLFVTPKAKSATVGDDTDKTGKLKAFGRTVSRGRFRPLNSK
jgi:hypothetical protein